MSDAGHLLSGVHPKKMFFLFHFCDFLIKIGTYVNCNFFSILRHITDQRSAHAHFQNNSFLPHQPLINSASTTHPNPTFQPNLSNIPTPITPTIAPLSYHPNNHPFIFHPPPPHIQTSHQTPQNSNSSNRKFFSSQINQFRPIFTPHPSPSHILAQKLATASQSTTQLQINQFFSTFDTTAAVFQFFTLKNRILYCHL